MSKVRTLCRQDHKSANDALSGIRVLSSVPKSLKERAKNSPYCNTGGYGFKNDEAKKITPNAIYGDEINVTKVDWLRVTTSNIEDFQHTLNELFADTEEDANKYGILDSAGIDCRWSTKGMHGYETSASLLIWKDNDYLKVGSIAKGEQGRNKGGMLELTGIGCKVLQVEHPELWAELYSLLLHWEWRISRCDVALDLMGDYAEQHGYNVPLLFKQAVNEGLFQSDDLRNPNMNQSFSMAGDWSVLAVGNLTPEAYNPLEHCAAGLTAYIGKRGASDDFFRIYEKGKELLGAMAEPEDIDRGWIRIEHEMSRKASKRDIPLDVMLRPDEYFCAKRSGVREIMQQLRRDVQLSEMAQWCRESFKREKQLRLSKKLHWAKHTYGRLVNTLVDSGMSYEDIIQALKREQGLKEFVDDRRDKPRTADDILREAA